MKNFYNKSLIASALLLAQSALAGPSSLSTVPMVTSDDVRPNIMLLMDSSGSMSWDMDGNYCQLASNPSDGCRRSRSRRGGNWWTNNWPYPQQRIIAAKSAANDLVDGLDYVRLGYATFDAAGNADGGELEYDIADLDDDVKSAIKTQIDNTDADGGTPLSLSLEGLGQFFTKNEDGNADNSVFKDSLKSDTSGESANDVIQYYCQKNFIIAMTDGEPNSNDGVSSEIVDYDTTKSDGIHDWSDYYVSDATHLLYDTNFRPDLVDPDDSSHINNVITYLIGFADPNVYGASTTTGKLLRDAATGDPSLKEGGTRLEGKFYDTATAEDLEDAFKSIANDIAAKAGSSSSVTFNTSAIQTDTAVFFAKFNTANWSGELGSYPINADGTINPTPTWTTATTIDALSDNSMANRVIYTYYDVTNYSNDLYLNSDGDGSTSASDVATNDGKGFTFSYNNLTTFQQADFDAGTEVGSGYSVTDYVDYVRGVRSDEEQNGGELRDRSTRIGDIVNSSPTYVGAAAMWDDAMTVGTTTYAQFKASVANRTPMVYVGANDGMLHGFNAEDGQEEVAYVPASVYSSELDEGLHYYADVDYQHRFYADLSPTYADVGVNNAWKSVIVGGNRAGGRSVFALDVTDPTLFVNNNTGADNTVMWEFTHPDMGGSYSRPQIAQMNNGRWAAIFGNGYNRNDNESHDGKAKLFIVYLDADPSDGWDEGTSLSDDYIMLSTESGTNTNNLTRNGLSTPRLYDLDGDSTVDRIFAGDIQGNMWVWDVEGATAGSWASAYNSGGNPQPLYNGVDSAQVTTQPIILYNIDVDDDNNAATKNLVVLFGTGQFITGGDKTTTDTQYFMGVHDNGVGGITQAQLTARSMSTSLSTVDTRNITAGDKVDWTTTKGWILTLPELRERVITTPFIRRNVVFFNTSIPDNIPCTGGGSGWQMAVEALDGLDPTASAFDSNNDGVVTSDDPIYSGKVFLNGLPSDTATLGDKAYTPGSDGQLPDPETLRSLGGATTRLSWGEIFRSE